MQNIEFDDDDDDWNQEEEARKFPVDFFSFSCFVFFSLNQTPVILFVCKIF
jgi:hypothetical protein